MSSSGEHSTAATDDYVDLSKLNIPTPQGWCNTCGELNIDRYFVNSRVIVEEVTVLRYTNVLPVITDNRDTYFVQAQKSGLKTLFVWNLISGDC